MTNTTNFENKNFSTEILYDTQNITETLVKFYSNAKSRCDGYGVINGPPLIIESNIINNILLNFKSKGGRVRYITEVKADNIKYCKQIMEFVELRHLEGVKGGMAVCDNEYITTATTRESNSFPHLFYSNGKEIVEQQQHIFEILWDKAIPSEERIKEIVEGIPREHTEVIINTLQTKKVYFDLIDKSEKEILIIFPSINVVYGQKRLGIIDLLNQKAIEGIEVKILTPIIEDIKEIFFIDDKVSSTKHNTENGKSDRYRKRFLIQEVSQQQEIKFTVLIVDKKYVLTIELKDNSKSSFEESVGLSTYSNSKPGVLSYVSIFENFWQQTELYEKLKVNEKMQKDFINIAAHELRTPVQSIMGYTQLAMSVSEYNEFDNAHGGFLETVNRNANQLHKLTEEILDVAKIESSTLNLKKESFNLIETIEHIIRDFQQNNNNTLCIQGPIIENPYGKEKENSDSVIIVADIERISQVLYNILDNAIKFTKTAEKIISITIKIIGELKNKEVMVQIRDRGKGIDKDVSSNLFTKFISTSAEGTGLGLFISKSIIEAHGGKMWAENNADVNGATFSFSLPVN